MKNKIFKFVVPIIVLPLIITFLGCPGAKRDELEFYRSKVDSLRTLVNNFVIDYNRLKHESYLENQPFLIVSLYQKYNPLFNQEDINLINNLLKLEQRPERIDRLERLKVFIYEKIVEKETAGLHDRIELTKYYITYPSKGKNFKYDELEKVLANEPSNGKRKYLYNSNERFFEDLKKINIKLQKIRKEIIVDSLRFGSYKQFASMVRQEDLDKFYQTAQDFVSSTNDYYFQLLYEFLRIRKISQEKFYAYDVPFLSRESNLAKYFKSDSVKNIFINSYYNCGIKIDSLTNLKITFYPLDKRNQKGMKDLGTAGFEIVIPDENLLYISQSGGCENYESVFSESAKLFPSIFSTEKIFEFNYFGGDVIPLTFKNLFSNFLDEFDYLNSNIFHSTRLTSDFIKLRAFKKLFKARKLCADFIVEYLYCDSIQTNEDSLVQIYSSILGYNLSSGDRLRLFSSLNDYFLEADLLKALFIESMMKTKIREKFGNNWFKNPELQNYLKKFIERGRFLTKDKFLVEIGYYDLDPRFYFNEIISMKERARNIRQR
ncbi:MAG: hypothetical protein N3F03_02815 [Ignavibacteria bacterium]|nr:hypothetical protein [Ignavibacteria bacterium]